MKVSILDSGALRTLAPLEIAAYLRTKGWAQSEQLGDRGTVWTRQPADGEQAEILLPASKQIRDYTPRLSELLKALSQVEARSQMEIFNDLSQSAADVVRIRLQDPHFEDGTIPLDAGKTFVESAYSLMQSAALATIQPRAAYQGRRPDRVGEFMEGLRLGQTERGSFVLTIRSPVPPLLRVGQQMRLVEPSEGAPQVTEDPFERRVTTQLAGALGALRDAAVATGTSGEIDPIMEAVPQGVSADMCEALVELSRRSEAEAIEISTQWSLNRPASTLVPIRTTLPAESMAVLEEAARVFRESVPREEFELEGYVVNLHREGTPNGTVTIAGTVDHNVRKVRVLLNEDDYRKATDAHRDEREVRCLGTLRKMARTYALEGAHGFQSMQE